jgi:hypothetical protein
MFRENCKYFRENVPKSHVIKIFSQIQQLLFSHVAEHFCQVKISSFLQKFSPRFLQILSLSTIKLLKADMFESNVCENDSRQCEIKNFPASPMTIPSLYIRQISRPPRSQDLV